MPTKMNARIRFEMPEPTSTFEPTPHFLKDTMKANASVVQNTWVISLLVKEKFCFTEYHQPYMISI
jgi:hypothetical protein